jgi:hypothetical protein
VNSGPVFQKPQKLIILAPVHIFFYFQFRVRVKLHEEHESGPKSELFHGDIAIQSRPFVQKFIMN